MVGRPSAKECSLANNCKRDVFTIAIDLVKEDVQNIIAKPAVQIIVGIELKQLPAHLEYVFLDNDPFYEDSFYGCLENLRRALARYKETNLVLNWEKCQVMVREGIVLGHKISHEGIEVDKAKLDAIGKLPRPKSTKDVRSFLSHMGFYRRFILDFSRISKPLTKLLEKDTLINFDQHCLLVFQTLKEMLVNAPIVKTPDWEFPFDLMCDASDWAVGVVLG
ncbi:uncharacterized mitochondrial protein AtMg00860-like [Dioscorea cayenensis subsp. rotundata]|uniref:Uncharacterized mitochondrial protein AtMg00860-like n=1 Tax=Dioscorea cayennensis subsp. rotundata TaxID=55577 RepID=A0AB40C4X5_DIOCR|nr:uncharacterized mitochondrial protein AtMg00860-like [Dioscorea cayenensis subsp. rotundata]